MSGNKKYDEFRLRLKRISKRGQQLNEKIKTMSNQDAYAKYAHVLNKFGNEKPDIIDWRRYTRQQIADFAGVKSEDIALAEKSDELILPTMKNANDETQYARYDVNNLWDIRKHFNTFPEMDDVQVITLGSLKGGSTKSTTTLHYAQYLALRGHRVLIVDSDPQASVTEFNGISSDLHITRKDTIIPFVQNTQDNPNSFDEKYDSLDYAIRNTHWPNIDIIPACLDNDDLSSLIPIRLAKRRGKGDLTDIYFINRLRTGFKALKDRYDYILIDGTPSLNPATTMYLFASDFVFTPIPARSPDYKSTLRFYEKLEKEVAKISRNDVDLSLPILGAFITRFGQDSAHKILSSLVKSALKDDVKLFSNVIDTFSAVDDAFSQNFSIYEIKPTKAKSAALKKAVNGYNELFNEMELFIKDSKTNGNDEISELTKLIEDESLDEELLDE